MIEAKQPFAMLYKYDLVIPWQSVDMGREVNKVKWIIHYFIDWFMFKRLGYFITHTSHKPTLRCGKLHTTQTTF